MYHALSPSILSYILAVHRHKHFGRAARECQISQPSLSAQVQKAEDLLGCVLFDRSKKPLTTTAKGFEVLKIAQEILSTYKEFSNMNETSQVPSGSLHVGIIPTLAPYIVPMFLAHYSKAYPNVQLTLSELKTEDIHKALREDRIDAALLASSDEGHSYIEKHLFREEFFLYSSEESPLAKRSKLKQSDLIKQPLWLLEEGHCIRDQILEYCHSPHRKNVFPNSSFSGGSLETLIQLVRNGHGCTLIPYLSTLRLSSREQKSRLKRFVKPAPYRDIFLIRYREHLKMDLIELLERSILKMIPLELKKTQQTKPKHLKSNKSISP